MCAMINILISCCMGS